MRRASPLKTAPGPHSINRSIPVAAALRRAGAKKVWLAGKGRYEGVDANLHAGCDVLAVLRETFDDLEVTR